MAKKKNNGGRPSKFSPLVKTAIEMMASAGMTDAEMSKIIGVTERTFQGWKTRNPEFFRILKDWKVRADNDVERSLYERACGYNCKETKAHFVPGKDGGWKTLDMIKHYPPDPTSMIFWLKNRQRDKWRDRQDVEHSLSKETAKHVYGHLDKKGK